MTPYPRLCIKTLYMHQNPRDARFPDNKALEFFTCILDYKKNSLGPFAIQPYLHLIHKWWSVSHYFVPAMISIPRFIFAKRFFSIGQALTTLGNRVPKQRRRQRQRRRQKTMISLAECGKIIVLHVRTLFSAIFWRSLPNDNVKFPDL